MQLEQTVTELHYVIAVIPERVAAIPPQLVRIRELEQKNELLYRRLQELRRQLDIRSTPLRPDMRHESFATTEDYRSADRDAKRELQTRAVYIWRAHTDLSSPRRCG